MAFGGTKDMDKMATYKINVIANNHQKNLKLNNPGFQVIRLQKLEAFVKIP